MCSAQRRLVACFKNHCEDISQVWLLFSNCLNHFSAADELTVPRYRTEKPSKSPPPPPPRRSFPSSPGITSRSGEPLIPGKSIKVRQNCINTCKRPIELDWLKQFVDRKWNLCFPEVSLRFRFVGLVLTLFFVVLVVAVVVVVVVVFST